MERTGDAGPAGRAVPVAGRHYATSCYIDFSRDEVDFMMAMESYKRRTGNRFPSWSEVLHVVYELGFRRPDRDGPGARSAAAN